jgi:Regulator of chromosome condensation (RCC1) repeat
VTTDITMVWGKYLAASTFFWPSPQTVIGFGAAGLGAVQSISPVDVTPGLIAAGAVLPIVSISGGGGVVSTDGQSFALDSQGNLFAWGANANGQLGLGAVSGPVLSPVLVPMVAAGATLPLAAASSGTRHGLVLDAVGELFVFGENALGELGNPNLTDPTPTPTQLTNLPPGAVITKIWAGNQTSMVTATMPTPAPLRGPWPRVHH